MVGSGCHRESEYLPGVGIVKKPSVLNFLRQEEARNVAVRSRNATERERTGQRGPRVRYQHVVLLLRTWLFDRRVQHGTVRCAVKLIDRYLGQRIVGWKYV